MQYFRILQYKLHSFNYIQDNRSTRGLLAEPLKKFPKSFLTFAVRAVIECLNEHL